MRGLFALFAVFAVLGPCYSYPEHSTLTRPPAFPLAVRNPYTNLWLAGDRLPGTWPSFWTGGTKGWTGMIRVDEEVYIWMGSPNVPNRPEFATQTFSAITPTQTIFGIDAGPVSLNVTFFSPVEHSNIQLQSIPLSHVFLDIASNDGASHSVQVYMDITGEWASSDNAAVVTWSLTTNPLGLKFWATQLQNQTEFGEHSDYPTWGSGILATSGQDRHMSGPDVNVRSYFITNGTLPNLNDPYYRCVSCDWPTFGVSSDLGQVTVTSTRVQYVVGLVRENTANWLGQPQPALWRSYWPAMNGMLDFFWSQLDSALATADALDEKIIGDAFQAGGQSYADILTLSLRQSYAGNEFSGNATHPLYYQKEISSGAFMQTVDVIYPATPMFIYLNITYLQLLLDPLFSMMENGVWTQPFAMHDIGDFYPNALGQGYGGDMPVEESANMIMMVGDIIFHKDANEADSMEYARSHFDIMATWATYLHVNCLYPVDQLTTDDFIGHTELNSGLALKGILGLATFAKIARFLGETEVAQFYEQAVQQFVPIWVSESMHADGDHLKMEYNRTDGYQFKYNALHDKLLGLNVVPQMIYDMEANYYLTKLEAYGIPFVSIHDYTKSDWEMWTAAAFGDSNPTLRTELIETLAKFLQVTPQRVPFTDWYVTATSNHVGFQARPVQGGHFALLALQSVMK